MSNASPSAGGVASYLEAVYGKGALTAGFSMLLYLSMVINESLVARTFGTYVMQLFDVEDGSLFIPALGVALLMGAIFYLAMDMSLHWGVLRWASDEVGASSLVLVTALILDAVVLGALLWVKGGSDPVVLYAAAVGGVVVILGERSLLGWTSDSSEPSHS